MAVARLGRMHGQWRAAVEMLRSAKVRYGVEPNIFTYTSAISACEKGRHYKLALEVLLATTPVETELGMMALPEAVQPNPVLSRVFV